MTQPKVDLTRTDDTIEIGYRVLQMLAEGYDGEQITQTYDITPLRAKIALAAYANRVLDGNVPAQPSDECAPVPVYNGWCINHGVFHAAPRPAPDRAALLRTEMERRTLGDLGTPAIFADIADRLPPGVEVEAPDLVAQFPNELGGRVPSGRCGESVPQAIYDCCPAAPTQPHTSDCALYAGEVTR